jgi:prephenate dehydratase
MPIIAFQGEYGANSDMACRTVFPTFVTLPCFSFLDAFQAVREGKADRAMIPVENVLAGRVADVHHLLPEGGLYIVGEHYQPIEHHLLGVKGSTLSDIRYVESHVQALAQCRSWLHQNGIKPLYHADTAGAARDIAKRNDKSFAAIASKLAGDLYGLESLATDIADQPGNTTRFLVLSANPETPPLDQRTTTSMVFRMRSVPAALYKALGGFATNALNITKLESYIVDRSFTAVQFYIDVESHPESEAFQRALQELAFFASEVKILGAYPSRRENF